MPEIEILFIPFTLTSIVALMELFSLLVAVITVVPLFKAVTRPSETVATLVSLDDQIKFLFEALDGVKVGVSVYVSPAAKPIEDLSKLIFSKSTISPVVNALTRKLIFWLALTSVHDVPFVEK